MRGGTLQSPGLAVILMVGYFCLLPYVLIDYGWINVSPLLVLAVPNCLVLYSVGWAIFSEYKRFLSHKQSHGHIYSMSNFALLCRPLSGMVLLLSIAVLFSKLYLSLWLYVYLQSSLLLLTIPTTILFYIYGQ